MLRGKLDSLQAQIVRCQIEAPPSLADLLEETLAYTHAILTAEVTGNHFPKTLLFGVPGQKLREQSHNPKKAFGVAHVFPSREMGATAAWMNSLRAQSREAETAAVDAFYRDGEMERVDLIEALNRLSSAFYTLECRCIAGEFDK